MELKFKEIYVTQQTRQKVRAVRLQIQNVNLAQIQRVNTAQIRGFNVTALSLISEGCLHFNKRIETTKKLDNMAAFPLCDQEIHLKLECMNSHVNFLFDQ